jgi:hypothetical protein
MEKSYIDQLLFFVSRIKDNVYIRFNPEILDFTSKDTAEIQIYNHLGESFIIGINDEVDFPLLLEMLKFTIFSQGMKIITWNWKNFITYVVGKTQNSFHVDGSIIDLKIIESYSGIRNTNPPKDLNEAKNRLREIVVSGRWKEIDNVYKKLHIPLMTTVIPSLETVGINRKDEQNRVYAYYEIDGQENGRLKCFNAFSKSYVPHAMTPDLKGNLKTRNSEEIFLLFDIKGMEVFMLAYLSKDKLLNELCKLDDVYIGLYDAIIGKEFILKIQESPRDIAKKIFLPIIYGQSASKLAERLGVEVSIAEQIIAKIYSLFPGVSTFIESYQKQLQEHGYAKDIFGKRRSFEAGKENSVKNFAIQSPAAVVCLEKLTHLYFALKEKADLAFTIHDGYAVYATKENWKTIVKIGLSTLSGESDFCPGLKFKISVKAGSNLNNLKNLLK